MHPTCWGKNILTASWWGWGWRGSVTAKTLTRNNIKEDMRQSKTAKNSLNRTLPKLVSISSPFIVWCPKNDWQLNPAWVWMSLHVGGDSRLPHSYFAFKICKPSFHGNASAIFIGDSVLRSKHKLGDDHRDNPTLVLWWYHLVSAACTEPLWAKVRNSNSKCTEKHRMTPLTGSEWCSLSPVRGRQRPIVEPTGLQLGLYYPSHPVLMDTMSLLASHYCLNYRQY